MPQEPRAKYRLPIRTWEALNDKVANLELRLAKMEARALLLLLVLSFLAGSSADGLNRLLDLVAAITNRQ